MVVFVLPFLLFGVYWSSLPYSEKWVHCFCCRFAKHTVACALVFLSSTIWLVSLTELRKLNRIPNQWNSYFAQILCLVGFLWFTFNYSALNKTILVFEFYFYHFFFGTLVQKQTDGQKLEKTIALKAKVTFESTNHTLKILNAAVVGWKILTTLA